MESDLQHLHSIEGDFERTLRDCKQLIEVARKSIEETQKIIEGTKATAAESSRPSKFPSNWRKAS